MPHRQAVRHGGKNVPALHFHMRGGANFIDYKARARCSLLVDGQKGINDGVFLSGPVLETTLFSELAEFVIENLPKQYMEFIKTHSDFISCGNGFCIIHG
jgi:hypothetical protein